jgi:hydroxyethylthiazole kinase-like sugar kinase family protein
VYIGVLAKERYEDGHWLVTRNGQARPRTIQTVAVGAFATRRECLDRILNFGRRHLKHVLAECVVKGTNSPIGPLSWHSSASSSIICHAPPLSGSPSALGTDLA